MTKEERKEYMKMYREKNKEKIKETRDKYLDKHKEKIKEHGKLYREQNKEKRKEYRRFYYEQNKNMGFKEKHTKQRKKYYDNNREQIIENSKLYYSQNKEKIKNKNNTTECLEKRKEYRRFYYEQNKEYLKAYRKNNNHKTNMKQKERIKTDPMFKLIRLIRSRTLKAVKYYNLSKNSGTMKMLGCDKNTLMEHLQKTGEIYDSNFNVYNYDSCIYHIDHKKTFVDVQKGIYTLEEVCHYTNLQILPAEMNLSKGGVSW